MSGSEKFGKRDSNASAWGVPFDENQLSSFVVELLGTKGGQKPERREYEKSYFIRYYQKNLLEDIKK